MSLKVKYLGLQISQNLLLVLPEWSYVGHQTLREGFDHVRIAGSFPRTIIDSCWYVNRNSQKRVSKVWVFIKIVFIAGSVFAAYASFGVKPGYLVSASVMSAPAALTLSKLLYPETEISKTASESLQMDTSHKYKFLNLPESLFFFCF